VIIFSKPWVNDREAISRWSSTVQFLDNASASERAYNWTLGLRWASRFKTAAMTLCALIRNQSNRSHLPRCGIVHCVPLLTLVLYLVAKVQDQLPILARKILICCLVCDNRGRLPVCLTWCCAPLTDYVVVWVWLTTLEHDFAVAFVLGEKKAEMAEGLRWMWLFRWWVSTPPSRLSQRYFNPHSIFRWPRVLTVHSEPL